ncbi:MAG: hypothetical protein ACI3ZG_01730 [Candidatus Coprenecus sp.]
MSKFWNEILGKQEEDAVAEVKQQRELTDDEKHSYRYFLQYRFIPDLVAGVSKGEISPNDILETEGWEDFMKKYVDENFFLEWDELHCDGIKINDTYVMAIYIFPKPRQVLEAAFGAVLINTTNNDAIYYTLEYSFDGAWVLGSMDQTTHRNYGSLENPGLKSFIDWVVEKAKGTEPIMITTLPKEDEEKTVS